MYQPHSQLLEFVDHFNKFGQDHDDLQYKMQLHLNDIEGIKQLGSGAFGAVFNHFEQDKVIKLSSDRDAYYMFARWCMEPEQQDNPYLPRIYDEYVFTSEYGNKVFLHVMEQLVAPVSMKARQKRRSSPNSGKEVPNSVEGYIWEHTYHLTRQFFRGTQSPVTKLNYLKELRKRFKEDHECNINVLQIQRSMKLIDTCFTIFSQFKEIASLDFHSGNIMLRPGQNYKRRGTGTLVITDPVSSFCCDYSPNNKVCFKKHQHQYTIGLDNATHDTIGTAGSYGVTSDFSYSPSLKKREGFDQYFLQKR